MAFLSRILGGMKKLIAKVGGLFRRRPKSSEAKGAPGQPMLAAAPRAAAPRAAAGESAGAANTPVFGGAAEPVGAAAAAVAGADLAARDIAARLADPGISFYSEPAPAPEAEPASETTRTPSAEVGTTAAPASTGPVEGHPVASTEPRPAVTVAGQAPPPAPAPLPPVVEFRNVSKTYANGFTAIKDVTFRVEDLHGKGEFVAVLGPSGCGKSTILRLIAGLTPQFPATTGEVLVAGKPVDGPGADRGMVFQDYTSFDNRTVLDNIAFGLECRGVARAEREERSREWIRRVGLDVERDAYKFPHQLSGGMRQRVAIARSLILSPRIILMDEPFGALDPATRLNMQDLLVSLWREASATVFFITHSVEEAVYLGDRVYIMSPCPGTILEERTLPAPDFPAREMQRHPEFLELVFDVRDKVEKLEESTRAGT
jgi:NitT/TauT family transport system ATP-binding protein